MSGSPFWAVVGGVLLVLAGVAAWAGSCAGADPGPCEDGVRGPLRRADRDHRHRPRRRVHRRPHRRAAAACRRSSATCWPGVAVGPFTPGLVADTGTAAELAELGVILLMFGVGIHFSIADLLAVRGIAIPGALGQIFVATLLGAGLGVLLGWGLVGGRRPRARRVGREHGRAPARARRSAGRSSRPRAGSPSAGWSWRTCSRSSCWCCCRRSRRCCWAPAATSRPRAPTCWSRSRSWPCSRP